MLIFNTTVAAGKPIHVIPPTLFGGVANTDIPVCLLYNQVHYESVVPVAQVDIDKTIDLVKDYLNDTYTLSNNDIPVLFNQNIKDGRVEKRCVTNKPRKLTGNIKPMDKIGNSVSTALSYTNLKSQIDEVPFTEKESNKRKSQEKNLKSSNKFSALSNSEREATIISLKNIKCKDRTKVPKKTLEKLRNQKNRENKSNNQKLVRK